MAIRGTTDTQETPTQTGNAPGVDTSIGTVQAPGVEANDVFGWMNILGAGSSIGADAEKYLETVRGFFTKELGVAAPTMHRLTEPNGAYAFVLADRAIILQFTAAIANDRPDYMPLSDYGMPAKRSLNQQFPHVKLLNYIEVAPRDYERAQIMAQHLSLNLNIATNAQIAALDVNMFDKTEYTINTDLATAVGYINNHNPHAVQPRADIGFTIYARKKRIQRTGDLPFDDGQPIAAVVGFTEMIARKMDYSGIVSKYIPFVRITGIAASLPLPGIVPLCLATAVDQFIALRRWIHPFLSFAKGKPNLGQLSLDPQNPKQLWFASNMNDVNTWVQANTLNAVLAIDVADGQAKIPALNLYGHPSYANAVITTMQGFFGDRIRFDPARQPFHILAQDFIGTVGEGPATVDSRTVDFLSLTAQLGAQDDNAKLLLEFQMDNPAIRARVVADKTGGTFRSLNRCWLSALDAGVMRDLATVVQNSLNITQPGGSTRTAPTDWLAQQADIYGTGNYSTTRVVGTNYQTGTYFQL